MHYCNGTVIRRIVDIIKNANPNVNEYIYGDGSNLMFRVCEGKVFLIFTEGPTCTGSILISEYQDVPGEGAIFFRGQDGSSVKLSIYLEHSGVINHYAVSDEEVHYIHDAMIGEGGQYYDSESGWGYVCDERGAVICFNDIEFVTDKMDVKKGHTCFNNSKCSSNYLIMSKNQKNPLR